MGCAGGGFYVRYAAYEWNPSVAGWLELILKHDGAFGLNDPS
jgi:hypothetical protein